MNDAAIIAAALKRRRAKLAAELAQLDALSATFAPVHRRRRAAPQPAPKRDMSAAREALAAKRKGKVTVPPRASLAEAAAD